MAHEPQGYRIPGCRDPTPGVWKWQFRIGGEVKTGKAETRIGLLAVRRVQLRIDRALRLAERANFFRGEPASDRRPHERVP